ncbi:response regulator [Chitinivorax sp. B]|uniref:response regulator n=1 Tax=Chitinivorax sp. B TaxID=2502235 RepID=UPI001485753E|nr:response regulator [Chitinivorax sp. B]
MDGPSLVRIKGLLPAVIAFAISLAATLFFASYARQQQTTQASVQFNYQAEKLVEEIRAQLRIHAHLLQGVRTLFLTNPSPSADEFKRASMLVTHDKQAIGILGLGFARRVNRQDVDAFLDITSAKLGAPVTLKVLSRTQVIRQEHYLVEFAEPIESLHSSIGLDFRSELARRAAIENATASGLPTISGPIQVAEGRHEMTGIIMVAPVYLSGVAPPSLSLRQSEVYGWLYLPLNVDAIVEQVIKLQHGLLDFEIFDGSIINERYLVVSHQHAQHQPTRASLIQPTLGNKRSDVLNHTVVVDVAGRKWTIRVTGQVGEQVSRIGTLGLPGAILILGILLSLLLSATIHLMMTGRTRAQRLAEHMSQNARTQAERFILAVEAIGEGIFEWLPETDQLWLAPYWQDLLNCHAKELPLSLSEWLSHFEPDQQATLQSMLNSMRTPSRNRGECMACLGKTDNLTRTLHICALAEHNADGSVRRIVGAAKDITAKLASDAALSEHERRLQLTIDCAELGTWDWQPHIDEVIFAGRWMSMLGYAEHELPQKSATWLQLMHPEDRPTAEAALHAHFRGEIGIYAVRFRMKTKQGNWKWINSIGKVVKRAADGTPTHMLGIHVDIDEIKQQEIALEAARQEAEAASRAKSEFLANMSHEIRTPMNAVIGFSNLLADTPLSTEQHEYTEAVRTASDALLTLINDILDLSKIESGKLELEIIEFDPRQLLESVMGMAAERARSKGLELTHLVQPSVPFRLIGDPSRLRQVVLNLVNNAIKFTEQGEVTVRAQATPCEDCADKVCFKVTVSDTGIGIPTAIQQRLFNPFSQADASTTRRFGGTGLGLSISQRLIDAMHGQIGVDSEEGEGSTFWFEVPLAYTNRRVLLVPPADLAGKHCLVVDDNPTNRELLTLQLAEAGITVEALEGGEAALARLAMPEADFQMAVIDMQMPHMDGVELGQHIRNMPRWRSLPMVMATSLAMHGHSRLAAESGFDGYITKPIRQEQLLECLRLVLNRQTRPEETGLITARTIAEQAAAAMPHLLLVEDNPVNQRVATLMLQKLGCRIDVANNGAQGLDAASQHSYDLIFMDCQMPVMDGYQAATEIRRLPPPNSLVPIIALTANAFESDRQRCLDAGMNDFLSKPVTQPALEGVLKRWFNSMKPNRMAIATHTTTTLDSTTDNHSTPTGTLNVDHDLQAMHDTLAQLSLELGTTLGDELLAAFRLGLQESIEQLDSATRSGDHSAICRATHRLKGSARQLGLAVTADLAEATEHAARDGNLPAATYLSNTLTQHCQALLEYIPGSP